MVKVTVWGGAREIGGSMVFLEDKVKGITAALDLGISLDKMDKVFVGFLQPRMWNAIKEFIALDEILPDIKGIYRKDYLKHVGMEDYIGKLLDEAIVTHGHLDHVGALPFVDPDLLVRVSRQTLNILEMFEEIGVNPFYKEFIHPHYTFEKGYKLDGTGEKRLVGEEIERERNIHIFRHNQRFWVGGEHGLEAKAFKVNHSLPSSAIALKTSAGYVVYVGDIGPGEKTQRFIEEAAKLEPLLMICEGTRIAEEETMTEEDVYQKARDVINSTEGLVLVRYAARNFPRIRTYYRIAKESKESKRRRRLVVDSRQAYMFDKFKGEEGLPKTNDENIGIYLSKKGWGLLGMDGWSDRLVEQDYFKWERKYLSHKNLVSLEEIKEHPERFIFFIDFLRLNNLLDTEPPEGSVYINSSTGPFNDMMELEEKILSNRLDLAGIESRYTFHASGHFYFSGLKDMIDTIGPRWFILMHTEHSEVADEVYDKDKVIPVERRMPVSINQERWRYVM